MSNNKWITYERYGRGLDKQLVTVPANEKRPMGFTAERPATREEIAAEEKRRGDRKQYQERFEAFQGRPEYKDAQMIASTLDLMDVNNHPLDRMSPQQWKQLRELICGR